MALNFYPTSTQVKHIKNQNGVKIWEQAVNRSTPKSSIVSFRNTRKVVNFTPINSLKDSRTTYTFDTPLVGTFTLSGLLTEDAVSPTSNAWLYLLYRQDNTYVQLSHNTSKLGQIISITATSTENNPFVKVTTRGRNYLTSGDLCDVMLNEGSTALPYYPYFSPAKIMPSLKAYGGTVQEIQPKLWYRYKPVEYINNGSTGYIATDIYPSGTDKIYVRASTTAGLTANQAIFGNYHDGSSTKDFVGYFGKDHFYIWRDGTQQNFVAKPESNVIYEFTVDYLNGSTTVKGDSVNETLTFTPTTFACDNKLPIGSRYNSGYGGSFAYNFYSVKYYRNNNLIGDFVPVLDTVNNVYGMFDTIGEKFYGNSGTGTFTGGQEIKRVEYIQSSGTQWINTGIYLNGDGHKAEIEYEFDSGVEAAHRTLFGAQSNQNLMTLYSGSGYACGNSSIGTAGRITSNVYTTGHHTVSFEMTDNKAIYILDNGTPKETTISASAFVDTQLANNLQVSMCANNNGGNHNQTYEGKIYKFKFWQHGVLIRDLVPVKVGTEYCMYDLIERKIYRKAGTGEFTGGSEILNRLLDPYALKGNLGNIRYGYEDGTAIPSEYERVEYIETTHTTLTNQSPVIKTNIIPNQDTICYIDYQQKQYYDKPSGGVWIFGARTSSSTGEYGLVIGSDSLYASPYNASSGNSTFRVNNSTVANDTNRHQFLLKVRENGGTSRRFDNQTVGSATGQSWVTYSEFEVDHGLWIFGCLDGDTDRNRIAMKLYSFKVWQGLDEELVADMIPVKKVSNNEYGMYDTVSKQFFGNTGTGSFTGGSVISRKIITDGSHKVFVNKTSSEYEIVEYIESADSTGAQYIDTGVNGNLNTEFESEFAITEFNGSNLANIAGDNTTSTAAINFNFGNGTGNATIRFGNKSVTGVKANLSDSTKYKAITNKTALTIYNSDGSVHSTNEFNATTPFTTTNTITLFKAASSTVIGRVRFYSFIIRNGSTIVRNFIPVKKVSNNEYGMYDLVEGKFYGNAGTGSFIGGSVIEGSSLNITELLPSDTSYYDAQTGILYKDWVIEVFDGKENWDRHGTYPLFTLSGFNPFVDGDTPACKSNYYEGLAPTVGAGSVQNGKIKFGYWNGTMAVRNIYVRDNRYVTITEWKAHLKELYDNGKPLICIYPLATPTTETKTATPISLTTKSQKIITTEAEIPVSVKVDYLGV